MRPIFTLMCAVALTACAGPSVAPGLVVAAEFPDRPTPGEPAAFTPVAPQELQLSSGMKVFVLADDSLPLVSLRLMVPTGSANDPSDKPGLGSLGAAMMSEAAGERTSLEQAAALNALAASAGASLGRERLILSLDCHADEFDDVLPLVADAWLRPAMSKDDWSRVHDQHINGLKASLDNNGVVARRVAFSTWFGGEHPYGTPSSGTVSSLQSISLADVQAWHGAQVHAGGASIVIAGNVDKDTIVETLNAHFGQWDVSERAVVEVQKASAPTGLFIVDRPGSAQTSIQVLANGPTASQGDRVPLDAVRVIMGGSFTSRLNRRLREELGYTYGARMSVHRHLHAGVVQSAALVRTDATAHSLQEFTRLWQEAHDTGFSGEELAKARGQMVTGAVDAAETRAGLAQLYADELAAGRSPSAVTEYVASMAKVDKDVISASSTTWLDPKTAMVVMVGDLKVIGPELTKSGVTGWTQLSAEGEPVKP
ncbi:MAG: zinc protease [Kiritimatiellia bacterium]|jgi:zinc protease